MSAVSSGLQGGASTGRPPLTSMWAWLVWLCYGAGLAMMAGALVAESFAPGDVAGRFTALLTASSFREALIRTHLVAATSTSIVLVAGVLFLFSWRLRSGPGLTLLLRGPLLLHGFPAALAYLIIFGNAGWINSTLQTVLGLAQSPLPLAFTPQALILFFVVFGLPYFLSYTVHALGPETADLEDAARLLGCDMGEAFRRVTLPLLKGALKAGLSLVYILAAGSLSVPMVIGGARNALLTAEIYGLVVTFADVAGASALSLGMILTILAPLLLIDRLVEWGVDWLGSSEPIWLSRRSRPSPSNRLRQVGRGPKLVRLALEYQRFWLILLCLLVCSPLYASFVQDWGAGPLPRAWTLRWYGSIPGQFWDSMRLSLLLSFGCCLLNLLLGFPLAVAWRFGSLPWKGFLKALVLLPIGVPGFLWGLGLLVISYRWYPPFAHGPFILLVGQSFLSLPFMIRVLMSSLEQFDHDYLDVAGSLGAGRLARLWRVLLPMQLPSVGVGMALVFVRSFGESNLALMVAPASYSTAPLWLYQAIGNSGIGAASALEVFLVGLPMAVLLGWESWMHRRSPWAAARVAIPLA